MNGLWITNTDELVEALKRGEPHRKILAAGDFELDPVRLASVEWPSLVIEGSGAANTRLHAGGWLNVRWRSVVRDLTVKGYDLFDVTNAPYALFERVVFDSDAAQGQSHLGKTWQEVTTCGGAIRIGADPNGQGNDNTYRISFRDCTFNFFAYPFDLRSSEWINAFELLNVTVNAAKVGLYSPSIKMRTRDTNFQCCEIGWMFAGNESVCERAHFERGGTDIVLGDYSFGNSIVTDAKSIERNDKTFPEGTARNKVKVYPIRHMGRFNAERMTALSKRRERV